MVAAGALLVELGLARWDRERDGLGELVVTELGFFAWLPARIDLDGETPPSGDRMIRDAGYLRASDGYIAPHDLPVPVSDN